MSEKKTRKRELIEWTVLITIISVIYLGGWHTDVVGKLQQAVLFTGIITPTEVDGSTASYDFVLKDVNGQRVPFESYKDKVVFLNFWATWCPPCIAEMPDIHQLYTKKSDSVSFVMISMDREKEKAIEFMEKKGFTFPVFFLDSRLPSGYDVSSIPTTYVLARDGKIKVENHGMAKYNTKKFRRLLSKLQ